MRRNNTVRNWLSLILLLGLLTACQNSQPPRVAILYKVPDPITSSLILGFRQEVSARYPQAVFIEKFGDESSSSEQFKSMVSSALSARPRLLATFTAPLTQVAEAASEGKVPIVFVGSLDPVMDRLVTDLKKPTLATGASLLPPAEELLALTRKILPSAKKIGILLDTRREEVLPVLEEIKKKLCQKFHFEVIEKKLALENVLAPDVTKLASQVDAILIMADGTTQKFTSEIVEAATKQGKPVLAFDNAAVEDGALAAVGFSVEGVGRAAGQMAVKILEGAKVSELPVAFLKNGTPAFNLKSAADLKIKIPADLLKGAKTYE